MVAALMSTRGLLKLVGAHEKDQCEPEGCLLLVNDPAIVQRERFFQVIGPDDNRRSSSNLQPIKPLPHTCPFLPTHSGLFVEFL